jgi:hypothetical protein
VDDGGELVSGEDAVPAGVLPKARQTTRATVAAARRRRRLWMVALTVAFALALSFAAGAWVGSRPSARDGGVGASPPAAKSAPPGTGAAVPPVEPEVAASADQGSDRGEPRERVEPRPDRGVPSALPGPHDFVTPSGNILCTYSGGQLDCHIGSGLTPEPAGPCPVRAGAWAGVRIGSTGPSVPWCSNVQLADRELPSLELAYGDGWARDGIACTARADGLRCRNDDGGVLLLSRATTRYGATAGEG